MSIDYYKICLQHRNCFIYILVFVLTLVLGVSRGYSQQLIDVNLFSNFSAAKASPSIIGKTLVVTKECRVNSVTIPKNIKVKFSKNGFLIIGSSHVVRFQGAFEAGLQHIFRGQGMVYFNSAIVKEVYPQWWGAKANGQDDDTYSIRAAINAAPIGSSVVFKRGTYIVTPDIRVRDEASPNTYAAFIMKSNMTIRADDKVVLKIKDDVSTVDRPRAMHMFFSNIPLSDIVFDGIQVDMNGYHNRISPLRPIKYNRFNQSAIAFSGTTNGVAAYANNVKINNCTFANTPGTSCIIMTMSNTCGVKLGRNWKITNCKFVNNGLDTDDHSSIYGWADDVTCSDNFFYSYTPWNSEENFGARVAMEIHGSRHKFINNKIVNYLRGIWVASNYSTPVVDVLISDNEIGPVRAVGIDYFRTKQQLTQVSNVKIYDNIIIIDDGIDKFYPKVAIRLAAEYGTTNWLIKGNTFEKIGNNTAAIFSMILNHDIGNGYYDNIVYDCNIVENTVIAFYVKICKNYSLGSIQIRNNIIKKSSRQGTFKVIGVYVTGLNKLNELVLTDNIYSTDKLEMDYGNYFDAEINHVTLYGNKYINVINTNYQSSRSNIHNYTDGDHN